MIGMTPTSGPLVITLATMFRHIQIAAITAVAGDLRRAFPQGAEEHRVYKTDLRREDGQYKREARKQEAGFVAECDGLLGAVEDPEQMTRTLSIAS